MPQLETSQAAPLALGDDGVIRIPGSRVTLDSIVHEFRRGSTAEQIQEDFPSLALSDIYGAIAYYLRHTESMEQYLREQAQAADAVQQEIETHQDSAGLRERLRQRRARLVK